MPTMEEYLKQPLEQRLLRLERTADDLAAAIHGRSDAALSRRPDAGNWAPKEVVCHLRDIEELFMLRFHMMLGTEEPVFLRRLSPEQWQRGSLHVTLGRMTFADWAALMAAHDDKHQDQLERALEGRA